MAGETPRSIHVLFVHGVGAHSRLSSLLQPWQSLRANTRNPETPIEDEDLNPDWRLQAFDDGAATPYLKMHRPDAGFGETKTIYFYEVNYSELAGVVRANHPLDLTQLFVGLDLAVNVARSRLKDHEPRKPQGDYAPDHAGLARAVQRLAGVLVAATVPILGLPSLFFRKYTRTVVATFTRFFEDVATLALDRNGEQLISAHVDQTVQAIVKSDRYSRYESYGYAPDRLVIAAHSLGTVITHSYLVRHGVKGDCYPSTVLTFGSPIGLVCWLWLFLDFKGMDFATPWGAGKGEEANARYFTWKRVVRGSEVPAPPAIEWINVVNHLDPIATAFPPDYVNLAQTPEENGKLLRGGGINHRFIDTGASAASAHTSYFDDRHGFLKTLSRFAGLNPDPEPRLAAAEAAEAARAHWKKGADDLFRLRWLSWLAGFVLIAVYVGAIARASGNWWILGLLAPLGYLPLLIGTLAFCQRFLCSKPTKRNSSTAIRRLPWADLASFPHRLRQVFRRQSEDEEQDEVMGPGPDWLGKGWMWLASFAPSLVLMLLPLLALWPLDGFDAVWGLVGRHWKWIPAAVVVFMLYVIAFAISEFVAQWRAALGAATKR